MGTFGAPLLKLDDKINYKVAMRTNRDAKCKLETTSPVRLKRLRDWDLLIPGKDEFPLPST